VSLTESRARFPQVSAYPKGSELDVARTKPVALMTGTALLASLALAAAPSMAKGHVTITFMEAMSSGTLKTTMETLTARFEHAYPNITVNLIAEPSYSVLQQKEEAAIAAGNPPTMGQAYEDWAASYAASKAIIPLTGLVHGKNGISAGYRESFWPEIWKDQFLPNGTQYMWPFNKSDYIMYYNANFLKKLGMHPPTTWSELEEVAKVATNKQADTWGFSFDPGNASGTANGTYVALIMAEAYGAHFYQNGHIAFASPQTAKALGMLRAMVKNGWAELGTNYPGQTALDAGHSVFDLSTVAGYYYIQLGKTAGVQVAVAPFPAGPAGPLNMMEGTNLVIFAKSTNAQRQAAWTFMKWLTEPTQAAYWAENTGYLPVVRTALPLMKDYFQKNPYQRIAVGELAHAQPTPAVPGIDQAEDVWASTLQEILTTNVNIMQALQQGQQQAQQALSQSQP
jgi:multiple sugar transport system substrate-binding protein